MSTRSTISVLCRDGLVRTVYCHQDSNLQHNGRILAEYYNSWDAAEALVTPREYALPPATLRQAGRTLRGNAGRWRDALLS
ncbi:hypothetical protein ACFW8Q_001711 [Salmonella enterica]|nr:hypothetical protein [Salmonella enterica]